MGGEGRVLTSIALDTAPSLTRRKNSPLEGINMLTAQKRKFAVALMSGMSQKDAAIKAGYSGQSARSKGSQLAKDPEVIAFIERKKNEIIEVDDVPVRPGNVNTPGANVYTPAVNIPPETTDPRRHYDDPIEYLSAVMNGLEPDDLGRRDAAKAMLPYRHSKMGETGKKDAKSDAARKAANKFAIQQPPKLVVNNRGNT